MTAGRGDRGRIEDLDPAHPPAGGEEPAPVGAKRQAGNVHAAGEQRGLLLTRSARHTPERSLPCRPSPAYFPSGLKATDRHVRGLAYLEDRLAARVSRR